MAGDVHRRGAEISGPHRPVRAGSRGDCAAAIARAAGFPDIVTADLGGTSFDVSLVANGAASLAAQTTIDFGLVVRTPMIEITTIGAGGGSIAHVDKAAAGGRAGKRGLAAGAGRLCPGQPAPDIDGCEYRSGRINADRPIGGKLKRLDVEAARAAIARALVIGSACRPSRLPRPSSALPMPRWPARSGWCRSNAGHDPTKFTAVPFGGGGALHVGALIHEVGLRSALVPRYPGITSALGCIIADIRHDEVATVNLMLDGIDSATLARRMVESGEAARAVVAGPR